MNAIPEHRRNQRVNVSGYKVSFVDYGCYYKGVLQEASFDGLRVAFPPIGSQIGSQAIFWPNLSFFFHEMIWRNRMFRIAVSTNTADNTHSGDSSGQEGRNCLVAAYPRWQKKNDTWLEIGFTIHECPLIWKFFVHRKILGLP
ncbi:MAG: hypothetical protein D3909_04040 [Candidatus Electrothrix sp. ATG1]|nr:hypothetical protein [Candidatus Electrothrix sp. ATG1]